jgi:trimeric autotransporter adhesin
MVAAQRSRSRGHGSPFLRHGTLAVLAMGAVLVAGGGVAMAAPRAGAGHDAASQARAAVAGGIISTVAGGVGGPGLATKIALTSNNGPTGSTGLSDVAIAAGHLYIADDSVRQVSVQTDMLTTLAGTGAAGPFGAGGAAARASIGAAGVAVDHAGNVVIADPFQRRVEVVPGKSGTFYGRAMTAGHIYPVAGNGGTGLGGTGVPATKTPLTRPEGVAVDGAGNLVIADAGRLSPTSGAQVRVVAASTGTFYGQQMTKGDIYTVAGTATGTQFSGDGGPAIKAGLGNFIFGIKVDAAGNLVIGDSETERVRVVAASTGTFYGSAMTAGDIYTVAGNGTEGSGGDGGPATKALFDDPTGVALDAAGNLLIADTINNRVRAVAARTGTFYGQAMTAGDVYTIAGGGTGGLGDGGPATKAVLGFPAGLTVEPSGTVIIADAGNGRVRVVAAQTGTSYGRQMTAGDIYTVAGSGGIGFCCDGAAATTAQMTGPFAVATDAAGNMVIADIDNNRIRVVADTTGTFYGQAMAKGDIYTVAGDGKRGNPIDGTPATQAELFNPESVAADQAGDLLITQGGGSDDVEMVPARSGTFLGLPMTAGDIYTVAGDGKPRYSGDGGPALNAGMSPIGISVDAAGNLVIADNGNSRVRVVAATTGTFYGKPMIAGDIYTVAGDGTSGFAGDGSRATKAELNGPWSVVPDQAGNLVIADTGNGRVRVVAEATGTFYGRAMTAGDIYTVAGNGTIGFAGDGGPAVGAEFHLALAVAVDGAGNIAVADTQSGSVPFDMGNNRVRVVAAATGTFYGVPMTAGDIYTVAGNGAPGFSGDGGPSTHAELDQPFGVSESATGGLLVADLLDGRVRQISR